MWARIRAVPAESSWSRWRLMRPPSGKDSKRWEEVYWSTPIAVWPAGLNLGEGTVIGGDRGMPGRRRGVRPEQATRPISSNTARGIRAPDSILQVDPLQLPVGRARAQTPEGRLQELDPDEEAHRDQGEHDGRQQMTQPDQTPRVRRAPR